MAVQGAYIAWRIRGTVLPFVRIYGQWVEEHIVPLAAQLTKMADAITKETYEQLMSQPAREDYSGDGSDEAEYASDVGLTFYQNITSMYQGTLNLFAAGLFHMIEQQLAALTRDGAVAEEGSDTQLGKVERWYAKHFTLDLRQFPSWIVIEELRLVANTTKHAEGGSARDLRSVNPLLFQNPLLRKIDPNRTMVQAPISLPLGGDGLYVIGDDFRRYHEAAVGLFEWLVQRFEANGGQHDAS